MQEAAVDHLDRLILVINIGSLLYDYGSIPSEMLARMMGMARRTVGQISIREPGPARIGPR